MLTVMQRRRSLNIKKTPPPSPPRRKSVRFADSMGMNLEAIKTIITDDIPFVPDSAYVNLNVPKELLPYREDVPPPPPPPVAIPTTCREAVMNSPNAQRRNLMYSNGPTKAFPFQCPSPTRNSPTLIHRQRRPGHDRHMAFTINRLHLDSDSEDDLLLDDGPLADCSKVKQTSTLTAMSSIPPWNTTITSMRNERISRDTKQKIETQKQQEKSSTTLPPWMSLYQSKHSATLIPEFIEPFIQMNFIDRVRGQKVCLENCYINPTVSTTGTVVGKTSSSPPSSPSASTPAVAVTICIRVVNLCFEKELGVRFTTNNWNSFCESKATFLPTSSDSWSDRFTATFTVGGLSGGQKVQFAIRYRAGLEEFWDNNNGQNYTLTYRI